MNPSPLNAELLNPATPPSHSTSAYPRPHPPQPDFAQWLWHDRLLRSVVVCCSLLLGAQLVLTLLHPSWIGPVTDWLLTALTWPELAVVIYATLWLHHAHWAGALSWWLLSAALLCYAVARTLWTVDEQLILHYDLPFPSVPDLVFALQYPFFFVALFFVPRTRLAGPRLIPLLDSLLWIGTAAAMSWYFILAPIFIQSWLSPLARAVSLAYPLGDLLVLFSLTVILLFPNRFQAPRPVFGLMMAAFVCLVLGDSVAVGLVLHPHLVFRRGDLPDLFWMACYLLIPVAAL